MSPNRRSTSQIPQSLLKALHAIDSTASYSGTVPLIISSKGAVYYAKSGSSQESDHYIGEVAALNLMKKAAPSLAPSVLAFGHALEGLNEVPYLITEYKDLGPLSGKATITLAKRLATELHAFKSKEGFGFSVPTFCGATRQANGWFDTWDSCYTALLDGLFQKLASTGRYAELCRLGRILSSRQVGSCR